MAEAKEQATSVEVEESLVDTEKPSKEIENAAANNSSSETRRGWFASLRSIFPSGSSKRERGTPITQLFHDIPGYPRILLIGLDAGGKTLLMHKFLSTSAKGDDIHTVIPSIGIHIEMIQSANALFHTYDIGGCRPGFFKLFDRALFREAEAVVFVVDSNDRDRALEAREELMMEGLLDPRGMRKGTPLLILANKQDLPNARSAEQIKTFFVDSISTSVGGRPCKVFPTTVCTGEGIEEAFKWLASTLRDTTNNENARTLSRRPTPEEEVLTIYQATKYKENK